MTRSKAAGAPPRRWREALAIYLAVALGASLGGVARALVSLGALALWGGDFPWGTLIANALGSFLIGFFATLTAPGGRVFVSARSRQFVMAGFCGGFTTFSIFSLETVALAEAGAHLLAGANVLGSLVVWLVAVWAGHGLAARLNRLGG